MEWVVIIYGELKYIFFFYKLFIINSCNFIQKDSFGNDNRYKGKGSVNRNHFGKCK